MRYSVDIGNSCVIGKVSLLLIVTAFFIVSCSTSEQRALNNLEINSRHQLTEIWGIQPLTIRLSANGYMLDFRYKVTDAEKAAPLFRRDVKPYLLDQASGAVFGVPSGPKVGSLRQTRPPVAGKNYFIIFANPGNYVKLGNKVTIVIGDLKVENLTVE